MKYGRAAQGQLSPSSILILVHRPWQLGFRRFLKRVRFPSGTPWPLQRPPRLSLCARSAHTTHTELPRKSSDVSRLFRHPRVALSTSNTTQYLQFMCKTDYTDWTNHCCHQNWCFTVAILLFNSVGLFSKSGNRFSLIHSTFWKKEFMILCCKGNWF